MRTTGSAARADATPPPDTRAHRATDRLAVSKLVSQLTRAQVKSPLGQCLLIRYVSQARVCVWGGGGGSTRAVRGCTRVHEGGLARCVSGAGGIGRRCSAHPSTQQAHHTSATTTSV
jgi:hypothetical protein